LLSSENRLKPSDWLNKLSSPMTLSNPWPKIWPKTRQPQRKSPLLPNRRRPRRKTRSQLLPRKMRSQLPRRTRRRMPRKTSRRLSQRRRRLRISQWMPQPSRPTLPSSLMPPRTLSHLPQSSTTRPCKRKRLLSHMRLCPLTQWAPWSKTRFQRSRMLPSKPLKINLMSERLKVHWDKMDFENKNEANEKTFTQIDSKNYGKFAYLVLTILYLRNYK